MPQYLAALRAYMRTRIANERGATMVEYGILVAMISIAAIFAIVALGTDVFQAFDAAQKEVKPLPIKPAS
jgi:Flp pilus assembly pilin Flp